MESLVVDKVSFSYKDKDVLQNFSFNFSKGKSYLITGDSGIGKSTLAKILCGHLKPSSGKILLNNNEITNLPGKHAFLVHQSDDLFPWLSVRLSLNPNNGILNKEIIEKFGLTNYLDKLPHELSGGLKKRLSLARAISFATGFIIVDEALSSIDKQMRKEILLELQKINHSLIVIFISHYPDDFNLEKEYIIRL